MQPISHREVRVKLRTTNVPRRTACYSTHFPLSESIRAICTRWDEEVAERLMFEFHGVRKFRHAHLDAEPILRTLVANPAAQGSNVHEGCRTVSPCQRYRYQAVVVDLSRA